MDTANAKVTYSTPLARSAMAYVLAGGRGTRLMELTDRRAKPAVYFGGKSRIIDFALSNAINSGIRRIAVATQYKAHSLIRHLQRGWNFLQPMRNESFDILPASQRVAENQWYVGHGGRGVPEHRHHRQATRRNIVVVLAGDHIYKMDYELHAVQHVEEGADVTVGCIEVPRADASRLRRDACRRHRPHHRLSREARAIRPQMPDRPGRLAGAAWASTCSAASSCSTSCGATPPTRHSSRDFGRDIIPCLVQHGKAVAHRFVALVRALARARPRSYWRDVGTLDAYFDANIDLTDVVPELDLYDSDWPIWTYARHHTAGQVRA